MRGFWALGCEGLGDAKSKSRRGKALGATATRCLGLCSRPAHSAMKGLRPVLLQGCRPVHLCDDLFACTSWSVKARRA